MEITRESTGELTATIKIVIKPADYSENVNKILRDHQRKANIPGFRPGHVPFGIIKKQFGGTVFAEEVNKLLSENLSKYIADEKLDILGQPLPNASLTHQVDWKDGQDVEFFFDLGLLPGFDLLLDKNIAIDYYTIKPDEHMVEKYVADMRQQFGILTYPETSDENCLLSGELEELDNEGNPLEFGISKSAKIVVNTISDVEIQGNFIGKRIGDKIVFNPMKATGNATETAAMLGITKQEAENLESDFSYTVTEISVKSPAEMDVAFFEKVFPEAGIVTEAEFIDNVSVAFENSFSHEADHLFTHDVQETLIHATIIPLPDDFLKRFILETGEGRLTQEEIEKDYEKYAIGMKWELIEKKIIKQAGIHVYDEEVKDMVKNHYINGWKTMQLTDQLLDYLNTIADKFIKDKPTEVRRLMDSIYQQRISEYVKTKVKLINKEMSYDEYIKIDSEKHI